MEHQNKEQMPFEHIQELFDQRQSWSDEEILAELRALPVLPDEDDPAWEDERTWREHADLFIALADQARVRRLQPAIPLLLERACYGDPGEIMRGLRHQLEAIVKPDWAVLADICMQAATYPQPGARLWAVRELGVLRDARALDALITALADEADEVRLMACSSLEMVCQTNPACRATVIQALQRYVQERPNEYEQRTAHEAIAEIESMMKEPTP